MDALKTLARLTQVEALKFWRKPVARAMLVLMLVGPIMGEVLLVRLSPRDAIFPRVAQFLFSGDLFLFIALITVVLSVMALGNDYELGTVRVILIRGVDRYLFILSKIIATVGAALANGLVYMTGGMVATFIVHAASSSVPFFEAAGEDILWRALGATGVIGLVNFVLSGIVMLALVLGQSSWIGMLAGLGYFFSDFFVGGVGSGSVLGVDDAYRYTVTYHALSILEQFFSSDPHLSLPRAWAEGGGANPGRAVVALLLYGAGITVVSLLLFHRQDLMAKT